METVTIHANRITLTDDELNTLPKAKLILDDFNAECSEGFHYAAAEMLDQFLNEDLRGGNTYIEMM